MRQLFPSDSLVCRLENMEWISFYMQVSLKFRPRRDVTQLAVEINYYSSAHIH